MTGTLVLVATPIGNLGDISFRAIETLRNADVIACEDTRHTRKLLTHHDISKSTLVAVHEHNELHVAEGIVQRIQDGSTIALVSDAGMPTISDPGQRVVAAVVEAGLPVPVIPGASAVISALAVSGIAGDRFCFEGFLPRKSSDRRKELALLANETRTLVFYESPHRIHSTAQDMAEAFGEARPVALVRELTKIHEEIRRTTLGELRDQTKDAVIKGECVLVVEGGSGVVEVASDEQIQEAVIAAVAAGHSKKDAAAAVAEQFNVSRRHVYELATHL